MRTSIQGFNTNRVAPPDNALTYRHPLKNLSLKGEASKALREVLAFARESDKFDPKLSVVEGEQAAVVVVFKQLSTE